MTKFYLLSLCLVLISYLTSHVQAVHEEPSIAYDVNNAFKINFLDKVVVDEEDFVSMEVDFSYNGFSEGSDHTLDISPFLTGDGAFIDASTLTVTSCEFTSEKSTVLVAPPHTPCLLHFKMFTFPSLTKEYLFKYNEMTVPILMNEIYSSLERLYIKESFKKEVFSNLSITPDSLPNSKFESTFELEFTYNFASEPKTFTSDFTIGEFILSFANLQLNMKTCFYRNRDNKDPISFINNKNERGKGIVLQNVSYLPTEDAKNTIVCEFVADMYSNIMNVDNNFYTYYEFTRTIFLHSIPLPTPLVTEFKNNEISLFFQRMPLGDIRFAMTFMTSDFEESDFDMSGACEWDNGDNKNGNTFFLKINVTEEDIETNILISCHIKFINEKKSTSFFSVGYANNSPITTFYIYDNSTYKNNTKFTIDKEKEGHYLRGRNLNPYYRYCLDVNDVTFDFDFSKYRITYNEGDTEGCRRGSPILTFFTSEMVEKLDLKMTSPYSQNKYFGSAVTILPLRYDVRRIEELINGEIKVLVAGPKLLSIDDKEEINVDKYKYWEQATQVSFKISNPLNEPFYLNHDKNDQYKFINCTLKSHSSEDVVIKSFNSLLNGKPTVSLGPITKENTINGEIILQCELDLNIRYVYPYKFEMFLLTEEVLNKKTNHFDGAAKYAITKFSMLTDAAVPNVGYHEALGIQWAFTEETLKSQIAKIKDTVDAIIFENSQKIKGHLFHMNITEVDSTSKMVNIELVFDNNEYVTTVINLIEKARKDSSFDFKPYTFTLVQSTFLLFTYCLGNETPCGLMCAGCLGEELCVSDFDCASQECKHHLIPDPKYDVVYHVNKCVPYEGSSKDTDNDTDGDGDNSSTNYQSSIYLILALSSVAILQMIL